MKVAAVKDAVNTVTARLLLNFKYINGGFNTASRVNQSIGEGLHGFLKGVSFKTDFNDFEHIFFMFSIQLHEIAYMFPTVHCKWLVQLFLSKDIVLVNLNGQM